MKIQSKLSQYSVAASAVCALTSSASAQLASFDPNFTFTGTTGAFYIWDVAAGTFGATSNGGDFDFSLFDSTGPDAIRLEGNTGNLTLKGSLLVSSQNVGIGSSDRTPALQDFQLVGFLNPIVPNEDHYAGFSFDNGGDTHYGWMTFSSNGLPSPDTATTLETVTWQQTASASAHVIPETSTGLLCLAAGSITAFRRRRKAA